MISCTIDLSHRDDRVICPSTPWHQVRCKKRLIQDAYQCIFAPAYHAMGIPQSNIEISGCSCTVFAIAATAYWQIQHTDADPR